MNLSRCATPEGENNVGFMSISRATGVINDTALEPQMVILSAQQGTNCFRKSRMTRTTFIGPRTHTSDATGSATPGVA